MEFKVPTIADIQKIKEVMRTNTKDSCEMSPANTVLWAGPYHTKIGFFENQIVYRSQQDDGKYSYSCNFKDSPNPKALLDCLLEQAREDGNTIRMHCITEEEWNLIEQCYPNRFIYSPNPDGYDYVYSREKLATLSGKKLHGKRNHIHRFEENYPDWDYETITRENLVECQKMVEKWFEERITELFDSETVEELKLETELVKYALSNKEQFGLQGGALRVDGEIIAITLGEQLTADTFVVHFEKAFGSIQGAYPMINREFVRHELSKYSYVNREEDLGIEGLRKAKMSYYPVKQIIKGIVKEI